MFYGDVSHSNHLGGGNLNYLTRSFSDEIRLILSTILACSPLSYYDETKMKLQCTRFYDPLPKL